jgi:hypothetical protein
MPKVIRYTTKMTALTAKITENITTLAKKFHLIQSCMGGQIGGGFDPLSRAYTTDDPLATWISNLFSIYVRH